jgi:peroxiredoxin
MTALVLTILAAGPARGATEPDPVRQAREALAAAARAYREVPALKDTLTYVVKSPSAVLPPKTIEILLGAGHDVALKDPLLEAVAVGGTLYLTKSDAPGKYVAHPYSGDLGQALDAVIGDQGSLFEPVQVAMRSGKDLEGWLKALRCKQLGPLRISGYEPRSAGGRTVEAIRFTADNGDVETDFDVRTHFLSRLVLHMRPPGAPEGVSIEISGELSPQVVANPKGLVEFDPTGRVAVAGMAGLDSTRLVTGKPAPSFEAGTLTGKRIALADLKGSVVVLDFWATWCAPCWKTLQETQRLADGMSRSGLKVAVYAVDTMEEFPTVEEKRSRAAAFFKSQGFTIPCLLDPDAKLFGAFGSPGLPSLVILAPDGTIFKYHQGLFPEMLETLEREVREAAKVR